MKRKNFAPGPVVLDVTADELTIEDAERIAHPLTGGVILYFHK